MPKKPYLASVDEVKKYRGSGRRGPLTGIVMDRGFIQVSWGDAGALGDAPSTRAHDQIIYIEEGEMGVNIDGVDHHIGPGQSIYIPKGLVRQARSLTDTRKVEIFGALRHERWEFANDQLRKENPRWKGVD